MEDGNGKDEQDTMDDMDVIDVIEDPIDQEKGQDEMSEVGMLRLVQQKVERLERESGLIQQLKSTRVDVAEVFGPHRVAKVALKYGLKAGEAMDLLTGWDFNLERHRKAAIEYISRVKPKLVIDSPECTMFSTLQKLEGGQWNNEKQQRRNQAIKHMEFAVQLYELQAKNDFII